MRVKVLTASFRFIHIFLVMLAKVLLAAMVILTVVFLQIVDRGINRQAAAVQTEGTDGGEA